MCLINGDHVTAHPREEFIWAQWCNKGLFVEELVRSLVCHFHSFHISPTFLDTFFHSIPISLNLKLVVRNDSRPRRPLFPLRYTSIIAIGLIGSGQESARSYYNLVVMIFSSCLLLLCV